MQQGNSRKRFFLHLDDGSVICPSDVLGGMQSCSAAKLPIEKAVELELYDKKAVEKLEGIIERLRHAGYRIQDPSAMPVVRPQQPPPLKKPHTPARAAAGGGDNWVSKCQDVLKRVLKDLGADVGIFYHPVKTTVLPDYYKVISNPIFLSDVERKLRDGEYIAPQEFADDVRQHWTNVKLYNPVGDPFRKVGEKAEEHFETWWAGTGLAGGAERARRATAGTMPTKYDPEAYDEAPAKPSASRQRSAKTPRAAGARTASHEVTSSGRVGRQPPPPLTEHRKSQIAGFLQELPEEHADHLMTLLPKELLSGIESGELELDFEALDNDTLQKIDMWLRQLYPDAEGQQPQQPVQPVPVSPPHSQPNVRVDEYSDEDYQEEDDSDSE